MGDREAIIEAAALQGVLASQDIMDTIFEACEKNENDIITEVCLLAKTISTTMVRSPDINLIKIREAAKELIELHNYEEEGMPSGQPTTDQWRESTDKLRNLLYS